ncbi:MAG: DUF3501 family protein [Rhodospirillales bacterium]|nr:DUF3501 family protein [Rhodospirillales bacterium]
MSAKPSIPAPTRKRSIASADLLSLDDYANVRKARRAAMLEIKKNRRVPGGPHATLYFECYDTMLHQVHEMLFVEKGGEGQIEGELAAYNPLIPQGRDLVATLMFEVDDPVQRARFLAGLGGVEETITLSFAGETITAVAETEVERTTAEGKTSAIHFLHFHFSESQAAKFKAPGTRAVIAFGHPNYGHMAAMPEGVRAAIAGDLD